jgi:hypothetical protein
MPTTHHRRRSRLWTLGSLLLVGGCTPGHEDQSVVARSALTITIPPGTLAVAIPQSLAIQDVALGATDTLRLADRALVREPSSDAARARVTNVGSTETNLGVDTRTGPLVSGTNVTIRGLNNQSYIANVIGDLQTAGTVTLQNNAKVKGQTLERQTIVAKQIPFPVTVPATIGAPQYVNPDGALTLGPGNYGDVQVFSRGTLTLHAGVYFMNNFRLEPQAHVVLENASTPVSIYVRADFQYRGTFQEQATGALQGNVFVGVLGSTYVTLEAPFVGTIVAPNSTLTLATVQGGHTGSFFARIIEVRPDVVVTHRAFPSLLIDHVTVSKTDLCVGEPMTATVATRAGVSPVVTTIDMQVGDHRTIQYQGLPGPRYVTVIVSGPGGTLEARTVQVNVRDCGTLFASALLVVRPSLYDLNTAEFRVLNPTQITGTNRRFVWTFGDGQTAQTTVPYVEHSYDASVGTDQEYYIFDANLHVVRDGLPDIVVAKTVTLWNRYAVAKQKGLLHPRADGSPNAGDTGTGYSAQLTIRNKESTALTLTQRIIERQFCDPARDPDTLPAQTVAVTLPPGGSATHTVTVSKSDFGQDACGFGVTLTGQAAGRTIVVRRYFQTRPNQLFGRQVSDSATDALLKQIRASGLIGGTNAITERDLARLYKEGRIPFLPSSAALLGPGALPDDGSDPIDQPCVPGDDRPRPGLSCQVVTGEPDTCYQPFIQNGLKGDLLLDAACGDVGLLLRQVSPPQHYSHEGMMTSNRYRVSHSTRSTDEVVAKFTADHEWSANFLRYGWPGMMHESITTAFNGNTLNRNGTLYTLTGFSQDSTICQGDESLNPPLVVKPFPGTESLVRPILHAAADIAKTDENHYRFYAFSNAAIGFNPAYDVPASLVGSVGESGPATVSSQSLWRVLKMAGVVLEGGAVEAGERQMDAATQDGLYVYTEQERRVAAIWMANHVANKIDEQVPDAIRFLSPGGEAGMQTSTCFAADVCSASEACPAGNPNCSFTDQILGMVAILENPGVGRAVAPDDFFSWDAPHSEPGFAATVGAYGYSEQLYYRSGECLPTTKWKEAPNTGTLLVSVTDETGNAVRDALVLVDGAVVRTGADGTVQIRGVSAGNQLVEAQCGKPASGTPSAVGCDRASGTLLSATVTVAVAPNVTTPVHIMIVGNAANRRRVLFDFNVDLNDDDEPGNSDECATWGFSRSGCDFNPTPIHAECNVDPLHPIDDFKTVFDECTGAEVRGTILIKCVLEADPNNAAIQQNVHTYVQLHLYEGTSCNGDETDKSPVSRDDVVAPNSGFSITGMYTNSQSFPSNGGVVDQIAASFNEFNAIQP